MTVIVNFFFLKVGGKKKTFLGNISLTHTRTHPVLLSSPSQCPWRSLGDKEELTKITAMDFVLFFFFGSNKSYGQIHRLAFLLLHKPISSSRLHIYIHFVMEPASTLFIFKKKLQINNIL